MQNTQTVPTIQELRALIRRHCDWARENGIPWMQIISIASYNAAKHLGDAGVEAMQQRGRMQEGMVADIMLFDPETVKENSDYAPGTNGLPPTGIPYVLVNGVVVVEDFKVLENVNPGQAIRYPVEAESRFNPLVNEGDWVRYVQVSTLKVGH